MYKKVISVAVLAAVGFTTACSDNSKSKLKKKSSGIVDGDKEFTEAERVKALEDFKALEITHAKQEKLRAQMAVSEDAVADVALIAETKNSFINFGIEYDEGNTTEDLYKILAHKAEAELRYISALEKEGSSCADSDVENVLRQGLMSHIINKDSDVMSFAISQIPKRTESQACIMAASSKVAQEAIASHIAINDRDVVDVKDVSTLHIERAYNIAQNLTPIAEKAHMRKMANDKVIAQNMAEEARVESVRVFQEQTESLKTIQESLKGKIAKVKRLNSEIYGDHQGIFWDTPGQRGVRRILLKAAADTEKYQSVGRSETEGELTVAESINRAQKVEANIDAAINQAELFQIENMKTK